MIVETFVALILWNQDGTVQHGKYYQSVIQQVIVETHTDMGRCKERLQYIAQIEQGKLYTCLEMTVAPLPPKLEARPKSSPSIPVSSYFKPIEGAVPDPNNPYKKLYERKE